MNIKNEVPDSGLPFIKHLAELRDRMLRTLLVLFILFVGLSFFANELYSYLAVPLLRHMPEGSKMIAIDVASPFFAPFKLSGFMAVLLGLPYVFYQAWAFVAPGLYHHEQRLVFPLILSSIILFYTGIAFAYFLVFPVMFGFFSTVAPEGVTVQTDISRYLDFVLGMFFAFGAAFEVPILTILMVWSGVVTRTQLAEKRSHIIVLSFVIGMILTPPDVVSQTLLAVPIWMLFEFGLQFARLVEQKD
ncbi:MAG: twin-arginine translocase subunit TatC [Methylococcaceae bacterium]